MVRGNWQKRVETAEARRHQARQRKEKAGALATYKEQAAELVRQLAAAAAVQRQQEDDYEVIFYTDTLPITTRERSASMEDSKQQRSLKSTTTARKRSGSESSSTTTPKKQHPRSKVVGEERTAATTTGETTTEAFMCRSYFFTGKCSCQDAVVGKKGGGSSSKGKSLCRWQHCDPLCCNSNDAAAKAVMAFGNNAHEDQQQLYPNTDAVPAVYRVYPSLRLQKDSNQDIIGDQCASFLGLQQVKLSQVVYVVHKKVLLFDRYRGGWQEEEESSRKPRSVVSEHASHDLATALPGPILEHIMLFLPASAVGMASQACRLWNKEIGTPALWKHLFVRHQWPLPNDDDDDNNNNLRPLFAQHSLVTRSVRSLHNGMESLLNSRRQKRTPPGRFTAIHEFRSRRNEPQDDCIAVLEWSPGVVLAAFRDNTLRLFRVAQESNRSAARELVCQTVDPYSNTAKRECTIRSVAIDDDVIGCLCTVKTPSMPLEKTSLLVVVRREDFVMGPGEGKPIDLDLLTVIDIQECVLNDALDHYIDGVDDPFWLNMLDDASEHHIALSVNVQTSNSIAALGHGRFLLHAHVVRPRNEDDDDEEEEEFQEGRLVVISSHAEAVLWKATQTDGVELVLDNATLASHGSTFAAGSVTSSSIVVGTLDDPVVHCTITTPPCLLGEEWESYDLMIQMAVTSSRAISASSYLRTAGLFEDGHEQEDKYRSVLVVYPLDPLADDGVRSYIIEGNMRVQSIFAIGEDYVGMVCLGPLTQNSETVGTLVVFYIPAGTEVLRMGLTCKDIHVIANGHDSMALVLDCYGVAMVGEHVNEILEVKNAATSQCTSSSKKKKKNRHSKRDNKKDGYARGMTLRG